MNALRLLRHCKFKLAVCCVYQHVLSKMSVRQEFKLPGKSVYVNKVVKSKLVRLSWQKASNLYVNGKVVQTHFDITSTK